MPSEHLCDVINSENDQNDRKTLFLKNPKNKKTKDVACFEKESSENICSTQSQLAFQVSGFLTHKSKV